MEVYPLLSLVRGWEILTIPGSLVNRRLMVFSLKNQSLFNSATVRCLFYRTRVLNDHLPERFFQTIDANWSLLLLHQGVKGTAPPSCHSCTAYLEKCQEKSPGTW
jgi:hypothetical protein